MNLLHLKSLIDADAVHVLDSSGDVIVSSEPVAELSVEISSLHAQYRPQNDSHEMMTCLETGEQKFIIDNRHPDWTIVVQGGRQLIFGKARFYLGLIDDSVIM